MSDVASITVLRAFKPFYRMLTVYNSANFRNADKRTIFCNLWRATVATILIGSLAFATIVAVWYFFQNEFQLRIIAMPFATNITTYQINITYISMRLKLQQIDQVIASLNETINQRTATSNFFTYSVGLIFCSS